MIYDFKVIDAEGKEISLSEYKGKVLLIVNTATKCGLTPQFEGLQKLQDKFHDKGFEVLSFPCNQFFEQSPEDTKEIVGICQLNYGSTFKTFKKINVNGDNAIDLYKYLKKEAPKAMEDEESLKLYERLSGMGFNSSGDDIKWNFTKFLIDKNGKVIARFTPTYSPERLEKDIEKLFV